MEEQVETEGWREYIDIPVKTSDLLKLNGIIVPKNTMFKKLRHLYSLLLRLVA